VLRGVFRDDAHFDDHRNRVRTIETHLLSILPKVELAPRHAVPRVECAGRDGGQ
jgi:hypothetical protein